MLEKINQSYLIRIAPLVTLLALATLPLLAFAVPVDYVCKVSGSYDDFGSMGKINETISVTIDTKIVYQVTIIGSERTQAIFIAGSPGSSSDYEGEVQTSHRSNNSSGSIIDINNGWSARKRSMSSQSNISFNRKTGIISYNLDTFNDGSIAAHTNYSGSCKKQ